MADIVVSEAKRLADNEQLKKRFQDVLGERSTAFMASVLNVVNNNSLLSKSDAMSVWGAAMVAASLNLPVDPNLGFSAIVPFKGKAQYQIMVKGLTQLAIRSGQYNNIHVTEVYEDELENYNPLTDEIKFTNQETWTQRDNNEDKKIIGYYAFLELKTGFKKAIYKPKSKLMAHGKKYSKSFSHEYGLWQNDSDSMCKKTILKELLKKWGILSIDMQQVMKYDQSTVSIENMETVTYDDGVQLQLDNPNDILNAVVEGEMV